MKRTAIMTALIMALLPSTAWAVDEAEWDRSYMDEPQACISAEDFMFQGVIEYGDNIWTWYSENVLPGDGLTALNENGRTVDGNGYVVDGDGYIALASPDWDEPIGTVVETPFGVGKVYDYCGTEAYDVYVSW